MNLNLAEAPTRDELDTHMRDAAYDSQLSEKIAHSESFDVVSTDLIGTPEPVIFDSVTTIVQGGSCVLDAWYENVYGYSMQVARLIRRMVEQRIPALPA